jgi:hypothetical protein
MRHFYFTYQQGCAAIIAAENEEEAMKLLKIELVESWGEKSFRTRIEPTIECQELNTKTPAIARVRKGGKG